MYATVRDVRLALTPDGSSTDKATAASLSDAQLLDAIEEAEGIVRMYVLSRYTIPQEDALVVTDDSVDPPLTGMVPLAPQPIRGWTRNIAAYLATLTFNKNNDVVSDDPPRLRYNLTMEALSAIRSGESDLELPPRDNGEGGGDTVHVENITDRPLFGLSDAHLAAANLDPQILVPLRRW